MKVYEYANDTNYSIAEILKKCEELGINVKDKDSILSDDDIIILDNTINLISTANDTTLEEDDVIDEAVEDILESTNISKNLNNFAKKQKLKKKQELAASKSEFLSKKKEMYKNKTKLKKNKVEDNVVLYHDNMTVKEFSEVLGVSGASLITKLMSLGVMSNLNMPIDLDAATNLARRSRKTPRIANRLFKRVRDFALVNGDGVINTEILNDALSRLKVDKQGLDETDYNLLLSIIEKFNGGPVGIEAIASSIGEEVSTIEDVYEPYLLQNGYLKRTSRGRMVTDKTYEYLGIEK